RRSGGARRCARRAPALRREGGPTLVLLAAPDEGEGERIAAGAALIDRAMAAPPLLLRRALRGSGIADD
ncbi:MAG: hypothetical protein WKH64_18620, partial [Chloroflexia bacterium]